MYFYMFLCPKMKQMYEKIHIGELIRETLKEKGHTISWFAKKLNRNRSTIYIIFKNPHIHTLLLLQISVILNHDFFKYLSEHFENK